MPADFSYDPVTALDEAKATGEAAAIFADIRETMSLPLVTSIWRGLAGMDDSLPRVWAATKPLFLSGLPESALTRALSDALLPRPEPLVPVQLSCIGLDGEDVQAIRTILAAYNRSNGMNLMALAALMSAPAQTRSAPAAAPPPSPKWPPLRPLAAREAIADDVWEMVRHVNSFGAPGQEVASVATAGRERGDRRRRLGDGEAREFLRRTGPGFSGCNPVAPSRALARAPCAGLRRVHAPAVPRGDSGRERPPGGARACRGRAHGPPSSRQARLPAAGRRHDQELRGRPHAGLPDGRPRSRTGAVARA